MIMNDVRFYVFHCNQSLPDEYIKLLQLENKLKCLKPMFDDAVSSSFSFNSDAFPENIPLIVKLFPNSEYAQTFIIVPLTAKMHKEKETIEEYQLSLQEESQAQLKQWFGAEYKAENFRLCSAILWLKIKQDEFEKRNAVHREISRFFNNSDEIIEENFRALGSTNVEYVIDANGMGLKSVAPRVTMTKRIILLFLFSHAYTQVFEYVSYKIKHLVNQSESIGNLDNEIARLTSFLICYYANAPFLPSQTDSFQLYELIKEKRNIENQYAEIVEQLRLLNEIAIIEHHKEQIAQLKEQQHQGEIITQSITSLNNKIFYALLSIVALLIIYVVIS